MPLSNFPMAIHFLLPLLPTQFKIWQWGSLGDFCQPPALEGSSGGSYLPIWPCSTTAALLLCLLGFNTSHIQHAGATWKELAALGSCQKVLYGFSAFWLSIGPWWAVLQRASLPHGFPGSTLLSSGNTIHKNQGSWTVLCLEAPAIEVRVLHYSFFKQNGVTPI